MRFRNAIAAALTVGLTVASVWVGSASAQQLLKQAQVGAALAFPLLSDDEDATYISITHVGPDGGNLHFNAISQEGWQVTDFDCPVTANETVLISFTYVGPNESLLSMECNFGGAAPGKVVTRLLDSVGVLFVANETHECKDGTCTSPSNELLGDFVVVDALHGYALSGHAISFQGVDPLAAGVRDRDYLFDNNEYTMFPDTLAANFIAPGELNQTVGAPVGAALFLFTLDGRANFGSRASLDIVFYDDEETPTSAHHTFDCVSIVSLQELNPNFAAEFLGSDSGFFYMTVVGADQRSNVHDNKFGNGNAIRVVGVHGWLMQFIGAGTPFHTDTAFARTLGQSMIPQALDGSDVPAFDGS